MEHSCSLDLRVAREVEEMSRLPPSTRVGDAPSEPNRVRLGRLGEPVVGRENIFLATWWL